MKASSVQSKAIDGGSSLLAISCMSAMACPELVPGAALPVIDVAEYMLYRITTTGPVVPRILMRVASRIISPRLFRTLSCLMSRPLSRKLWSAWMLTCHVRPNSLKLLT